MGPILAANGLRLFGTVSFFPPCDRLRLGCESRYLPLTKCFSTSRLETRTKESNMCASARGVYPPARNESKGASLRGAEVGSRLGEPPTDHAHSGCRERSEEHTYELQSLMRISYAVFCLIKTQKYYT